jgi:NAD(P)-dependent dehydrogenase (short-subunit alcohol dehydrogenase family)
MTQMDGQVALVTGASSGIGRATALAFAAQGASVVVADVDDEKGEVTAAEIRDGGGRALYVHADVADAVQVAAMVERTVSEFGRLDHAFNNAGIEGDPAPLAECPRVNWDHTLAVNLTGVFLCLQAEIPALRASGGGSIVNCASIAGLVGFPGLASYVASKHGVNGLTKAAALELAPEGIRVNSVCPGAIDTEMVARVAEEQPELIERTVAAHPLGRLGRSEEIASTVVWLCSEAAGFVTGQTIAADGGYTTQ